MMAFQHGHDETQTDSKTLTALEQKTDPSDSY